MSIEIELKLQLDAKTARALAKHPLLAKYKPQTALLLNTYYDTPKLSLHKRLTAVRYRKKGEQWLCTVKTAEPSSGGLSQRGEWETPASPGEFDFSHVDNQALRKLLEKKKGKLQPVFTTNFKRQTWEVAFGESLIELALDRGQIESCGRQEKICEIELELISGKTSDLFGLALELQKTLLLRPYIPSKAERGYNLFLNRPLTPFHAQPVAIHKKMTPIEAFRVIALNCLEHFQRNESGLLKSDNPEFVHQARVAIRRLRTALWLFRPLLPPEFTEKHAQKWKALAQMLGNVRDWDVLLTETLPAIELAFPTDSELTWIKAKARKNANTSLQSLRTTLNASKFPRNTLKFTKIVVAPSEYSDIPLQKLGQKKIEYQRKKIRGTKKHLEKLSIMEMHQLRVRIKRLRYAYEFLRTLNLRHIKSDSLHKLIKYQEILGSTNDLANAHRLISSIISSEQQSSLSAWLSPPPTPI